MNAKPASQTLFPWLREQLGKRCLAPLCSGEPEALRAAVEIVAAYAYSGNRCLIEQAFATVVQTLQPHCRRFAYHAIAHVLDWPERDSLWQMANLPDCRPGRCANEPQTAGV